ncbi:YdbL family protein [Morganella psychrotolerans]|uniref:YdbL family protein n=1 Tax=Morganella psychrotolerans TaxID=368603 RepID=UPI0039AFFA37
MSTLFKAGKFRTGAAALTLMVSSSAFALTLDEAKQQGLAGETFSGYIAQVESAASRNDVKNLVKEINAARSQKYSELAQGNRMKADEVAKIAGQKLVTRAPKGEYVLGINGQWLKKE